MTSIYINYPVPHFTAYRGKRAADCWVQRKVNRRVIRISEDNYDDEMKPFLGQEFRFGATPAFNDLWLELDFGNEEYELQLGFKIQELLGVRYRPLQKAIWNVKGGDRAKCENLSLVQPWDNHLTAKRLEDPKAN